MTRTNSKWLEPIGLVLLLGAFIWQTSSFYHSEINRDMQLSKIEEAIDFIVSTECDEALNDSTRYNGCAIMWKNYDSMLDFVNSYYGDREIRKVHVSRAKLDWWIQLIMYVMGSVCILYSKCYYIKNNSAKQ